MKKLLQNLSYLVLLSIFCGFIIFNNSHGKNLPDLVYCPLQKKWIKKELPELTSLREIELKNICAPKQTKDIFLKKLGQNSFSRVTLISVPEIEDLFLSFTVNSAQPLLLKSNTRPDVPLPNLAHYIKFESYHGNDKFVVSKSASEAFFMTENRIAGNFKRPGLLPDPATKKFDGFPENTNPRGPPLTTI